MGVDLSMQELKERTTEVIEDGTMTLTYSFKGKGFTVRGQYSYKSWLYKQLLSRINDLRRNGEIE